MQQAIPGPCGTLEAIWSNAGTAGVAVIAHPHPLYGGDMHNKVVHRLHAFYSARNCATLRFNYRGVGSSCGTYDEGVGEVEDMRAAVEWVQRAADYPAVHLAGFSFGAGIAAAAVTTVLPDTLVLVAPPLGRMNMPEQLPQNTSAVVVLAGDDDVVDNAATLRWTQSQSGVQVFTLAGASHFFHSRLTELQDALDSWADDSWT